MGKQSRRPSRRGRHVRAEALRRSDDPRTIEGRLAAYVESGDPSDLQPKVATVTAGGAIHNAYWASDHWFTWCGNAPKSSPLVETDEAATCKPCTHPNAQAKARFLAAFTAVGELAVLEAQLKKAGA